MMHDSPDSPKVHSPLRSKSSSSGSFDNMLKYLKNFDIYQKVYICNETFK